MQHITLNAWTTIGMLSYVLLIASMSMRSMLPLRLFAIASGACGAAYGWFHLRDWVTGSWEMAFVAVNLVQVSILLLEQFHDAGTAEEQQLQATVFAELDRRDFRALMRIAQWHTLPAGVALTEQGRPVEALMLLVSGSVAVEIGAAQVAVCRSGDFIGELSFFSGAPASATTIARSALRYLSFDAGDLRNLVARETRLERALQRILNVNLAEKLRSTSMHTA